MKKTEPSKRSLRDIPELDFTTLRRLPRGRYAAKARRSFAVALVEAKQDIPPEPAEKTPKPKRPGHGRRRLPKHLERRPVVYDVPPEERSCPECHGELRPLGEDRSERLEYVPASLYVIEEIVRKYACRKGCGVVTGKKPMQPIEKGLAGPGLLAHVAVTKFADHVPLHRQEVIFAREGVTLSRRTMCDWMGQCAELVRPLFELMRDEVLRSKMLQTDDTPVAVLDPELPRTRVGRIWTYVGDGEHPYTVYDYTPDRST
jgi:transposase